MYLDAYREVLANMHPKQYWCLFSYFIFICYLFAQCSLRALVDNVE